MSLRAGQDGLVVPSFETTSTMASMYASEYTDYAHKADGIK